MQASHQAIGRSSFSPSTALLFQHIPGRACTGFSFVAETNGALMCIFADGMTSLYPIPADELADSKTRDPETFLIGEFKDLGGNQTVFKPEESSGGTGEAPSDTVLVYDYPITDLRSETFQVHKLPFMQSPVSQSEGAVSRPSSSYYRPPRRVLLSDDKKKLLVLDICLDNNSMLFLGVFDVNMRFKSGGQGQFFETIFKNESSCILDACFTPDSQSIICITRNYPDRLFLFRLPTSGEVRREGDTDFHPRICGPLRVVGPGPMGIREKPISHDRIICTSETPRDDVLYILTWNSNNPLGEYSTWSIPSMTYRFIQNEIEMEVPAHDMQYSWTTKYLFPCNHEFASGYVENESSPKEYIVDGLFAPWDSSNRWSVGFLTQREEFSNSGGGTGRGGTYSGLGMRMIDLMSAFSIDVADETKDNQVWYRVLRTPDRRAVSQFCWTSTLSLGAACSLATVAPGHGQFELSGFAYGSTFQGNHQNFPDNVTAFSSVNPNTRYWLGKSGALRQFAVKSSQEIVHPPWDELFQQLRTKDKQLPWRMLAAKIGYHILKKEVESSGSIGGKSQTANQGKSGFYSGTGANDDVVCGLHLYRCFNCRKVLLKPMRCGSCGTVAYCGRKCQRSDWPNHRSECQSAKSGKNSS